MAGRRHRHAPRGVGAGGLHTEGYARHWREFEGWCDEEGLDPLPATPQMIFAYVGALAEKGTIAASSLQPYLSASAPT